MFERESVENIFRKILKRIKFESKVLENFFADGQRTKLLFDRDIFKELWKFKLRRYHCNR